MGLIVTAQGAPVLVESELDWSYDWLPVDPATVVGNAFGLRPPRDWFTELIGGFGPDSPPHVTPEGRVNAVAWAYDGVCHMGMTADGMCWAPTPSPTDNSLFHVGQTVTQDGTPIRTGNLNWRGHDPALDGPTEPTLQQSQAWYNDPTHARATGRILETPEAAYFVGALTTNATAGDVAMLIGSALSGDWRWDPLLGEYDTLGPAVVARPGLPNADVRNPARRSVEQVLFELIDAFELAADGRPIHTHRWRKRPMKRTMTEVATTATAGGSTCSCGGGEPVTSQLDMDLATSEVISELIERVSALESMVARMAASDVDVSELAEI